MQQTLLRIGLPEGRRMYASRFRELLARECNLPSLFFHRGPDGRTLGGQPLVRVVGGKSWVGILGDGEEGLNLVDMAAGQAIRAVTGEMGANAPVSMETTEPQIQTSDTLIRYWVREMVVKRRSKARREASPESMAEHMILQGLLSGAARFRLDESLLDDMAFRVEEVHRPRGLRISTTSGDTNEYATLMDVEFTINRKLSGVWFAGNLQSRGYGRIGRSLGELKNGSDKPRETIK